MIMDVWGSADPVPDAKSISRRAKNLPKTGLTPNYEIRLSFSLGPQQLDCQRPDCSLKQLREGCRGEQSGKSLVFYQTLTYFNNFS